MNHQVGKSRNGLEVYVDLIGSDAARHVSQQPHLLGLVAEVLRQTPLRGTDISIECDMGRNVGYDYVVSTKEADTIFYAKLLRDETYTRFVKNGKPLQTQFLTLVLHQRNDATYKLRDVWIGHVRPPRPGASNENTQSRAFWDEHAFVLDDQAIQTRTVTKVCPY